jgi:beta-N-acetylhexosaminidase
MTAHIVVPALDASAPATLSSTTSRTLLRENLGFSGVCVTDCLEMAAIAETVGVTRGAILALVAGADLLLVSRHIHRAREARDAIVKAVEIGELPIERVIEASARVQRFRNGLPGLRQPLVEEEGEDLAAVVTRRSLTAPRDMAVLRAEMPVTILSFEKKTDRETPGQEGIERFSLNLALRRRRVRSEVMRVPLDPSDAMIAHLQELITLQSDRELILLIRRAHVYEAQRRAIEMLLAHRPSALVISLAEPFDLALVPQARRVLCTFGECEATVEALADALVGKLIPTGRLPVSLAPPGRIL